MGKIKKDEVRGYSFCDGVNAEVVCKDCVTDEDLKELKEDEILTESELDSEEMYFCDRCKEEIL